MTLIFAQNSIHEYNVTIVINNYQVTLRINTNITIVHQATGKSYKV